MCPALRPDTEILRTSEDAYERFILQHLQHYGLFTGRENARQRGLSRGSRWRSHRYHHSSPLTDRQFPDSQDSNPEEEEEDQDLGRPISLLMGQVQKTRQLIIDLDGERPVHRLREPLDLFAIPSPSRPFQGVRWPIECEVIKEPSIHHIEWSPPDPEPFYQPTGHERAPIPVGNEVGNVVYCINPAMKSFYFTCSRVGGSRGPLKNASACSSQQKEPILAFESRFESGNLQKAVQVGIHDYELTLRTDMYTTKHTQWFYFRVMNMKASVTYRFTITNLMKSRSLYSLGMRPLLYSERAATETGISWRRAGSNIRYYRNQQHAEQDNSGSTKALYCLTWTFQFPFDSDTCYLAHCYPYTYTQLQRYLSRLTSDPDTAACCKLRVLCRSLAGNPVHVLTVTAPGGSWEERRARQAVVLTARVHPGETNASWMMQGFLDFLLGPSDDARLLRDTFVFKVVPMLNPDGVVVGNYRCSLAGRDLNRNYRTLLRDSFPCVWHTRNMVKRLMSERDVVLYCDFHGHSRKNNVFMYGCDNRHDASRRLQERVFPLMMSKNANDKFSFRSCKFRVQKSKEGTGRIVMWKLGIKNSYTMESTFGGSTLGNRKGTHFTTGDLKSLGYCFCDTLLDFCDPDSTKKSHCLAELEMLLRQEVKQRLGRELDSEGSLCGVSVSDMESSTSGSNSTESDGLPVHLLNLPRESSSVKTKHLRSRKERNRLRLERHRTAEPKNRNIKQKLALPQEPEEADVEIQKKTVASRKSKLRRDRVPFVVKISSQSVRSWIPNPANCVGVLGQVTLWQEDSSDKRNDLKAVTAAYPNREQPRQTSPKTDKTEELEGEKPQCHNNQQRFRSFHSPHRYPLTVTPILHYNPAGPIQPQTMPFNPHSAQRGRLTAHPSAAQRFASVVPGLQCRVVPEFVPSRSLEFCPPSNFYRAKSHYQQASSCETQGQASRVSVRYYLPEGSSYTDSPATRHRSIKKAMAAGSPVGAAEGGAREELEQRAGAPGPDNLFRNSPADMNGFLRELRTLDFRGRSQPWGDQAGLGLQRTGPSKRDQLRGGGELREPRGDTDPDTTRSLNNIHRSEGHAMPRMEQVPEGDGTTRPSGSAPPSSSGPLG
ncbi:cytosolic carboxypeptidase 2 [Hypomesus transpacificus]|uniref:cytosolic carboxypeptidase 2 n=1 Tax=Hypomesus transpacificus TaxID=137520 RepID=UPI001F07FBF7|nr:cytosolic carboxypeptidase 2 [Hypomesus transpacificus]